MWFVVDMYATWQITDKIFVGKILDDCQQAGNGNTFVLIVWSLFDISRMPGSWD